MSLAALIGLCGLLLANGEAPFWRPDSFGMAIVSLIVYTIIGILASFLGFKLWDRFTPGNLEEEICKKQNIAAAIVGAAIILGVCLIVAAAIVG
jgi:uncharacterized membrane protein YjfL (UPF0719 family)